MKVWSGLFLWDVLKNYLFVLSDSAVYLPFPIGLYLWDPSGIYAALVFLSPCNKVGTGCVLFCYLASLPSCLFKRLKTILTSFNIRNELK